MRELSVKWVPKCLKVDQKRQRAQSFEQLLEFFSASAIQTISCRDWWPWTKTSYITMTRRQSNNQWSFGIAAQPAPPPKNSECKNPLEKFSPRLFGIKTKSPSLIIFQRAKLSTRSIIQLKDILKEKYRWAGSTPSGSCSCTTTPRLTAYLQPKRNWPTWTSSLLITHPILRIWPRRTTTWSLDWKNNWNVATFGPTRRSLLPRRPVWTAKFLNFFCVACKS